VPLFRHIADEYQLSRQPPLILLGVKKRADNTRASTDSNMEYAHSPALVH
jgi:hypothetical protein